MSNYREEKKLVSVRLRSTNCQGRAHVVLGCGFLVSYFALPVDGE